jgi:hypothetical protein
MLSALRASHALPQKKLVVLISVTELKTPRAIVRLEEFDKLKKKFSDLIETRTSDLSASSIAPQPALVGTATSYVLDCRRIAV